jgi:hypothetical protein
MGKQSGRFLEEFVGHRHKHFCTKGQMVLVALVKSNVDALILKCVKLK